MDCLPMEDLDHPCEQEIQRVVAQFQKSGTIFPVVVTTDNYIVAGAERMLAAKRLGMAFPYLRLDFDSKKLLESLSHPGVEEAGENA